MEFSSRITEHSGAPVVSPTGEIDLYTAPEFREAVESAVSRANPWKPVVVIDLSRVGFIDSSGVGVLIGCHRRLEGSGGELRVVAGEGPARKILRVTSLDTVFKLFHSAEAATSDLEDG